MLIGFLRSRNFLAILSTKHTTTNTERELFDFEYLVGT